MYKGGMDSPPAGEVKYLGSTMKYGVAEDDTYSLPRMSTLEVQRMVFLQ